MSDIHRRYRAIKRALLQTLPARRNSHHEKHLNTLAALICGLSAPSTPVAQDCQ